MCACTCECVCACVCVHACACLWECQEPSRVVASFQKRQQSGGQVWTPGLCSDGRWHDTGATLNQDKEKWGGRMVLTCAWCQWIEKKHPHNPRVLTNHLPRAVGVVLTPSFQLVASGSLVCERQATLLTHQNSQNWPLSMDWWHSFLRLTYNI